MGEYLLSLVGVSVFLALISYLSYPSAMGKTAKFASLILLIYTVASPLPALLDGITDYKDAPSFQLPDTDLSDTYGEVVHEAFDRGIEIYVIDKYGASENDITVESFGFDFELMRAELITVTLSGKAIVLDYRDIERSVGGLGLGECEVYIKFG